MTSYRRDDEESLLAIRATIITAIASDDKLFERFVLKGGNAIDIVYKLGQRSSLDVDFSMADDFPTDEDMQTAQKRLFAALGNRFDAIGYVLFDQGFETRPLNHGGIENPWGGYNATFKLITRNRYVALGGTIGAEPSAATLNAMRQESMVTGIGSQRKFTIEISKHEFVKGKQLMTVEGFELYVYSPAMIAIEKLRAICQQSPNYGQRAHPAPRPRDFLDIHTIVTATACDLVSQEHLVLAREIFRAKQVDLALLTDIAHPDRRSFHRLQWQGVVAAVRGGTLKDFDFYFDFVVALARQLLAALEA